MLLITDPALGNNPWLVPLLFTVRKFTFLLLIHLFNELQFSQYWEDDSISQIKMNDLNFGQKIPVPRKQAESHSDDTQHTIDSQFYFNPECWKY